MALPDVVVGSSGHVTHHNVLHDWTQFDQGVRYVQLASLGGSDSNDGRTPMQPKATLQSAYDALPSLGGVLVIGPGRFSSSGTLLAIDTLKPVYLLGSAAMRSYGYIYDTVNTVFSRTAAGYPASTIDQRAIVTITNASNDGNGCTFENITFDTPNPTNAGATAALYSTRDNHTRVENCQFNSANAAGWNIYSDVPINGDGSWWRVLNNRFTGGGHIRVTNSTGNPACDNWIISNNEFYGGYPSGTINGIDIDNGTRSVISNNQFQAYGSSQWPMYLKCARNFTIIHNGGEQLRRFLRLDDGTNGGSAGNMIFDFGLVNTDAGLNTDVMYQFDGTGGNNVLFTTIVSGLFPSATTYIKDNTPAKRNYYMNINGSDDFGQLHWMPQTKRGTGDPNGVVNGRVGDLFMRSDGGATTSLYVKTSGNDTTSTWTPK